MFAVGLRLKILADQLLAAPFFAYTFFLGMGLLERKTVRQINTEFTKKFPTVYAGTLCECSYGRLGRVSFLHQTLRSATQITGPEDLKP
ncbi:hypothetical protein B566_EDAN010714 [Ephemera danica]|nr:hypothetical protein B566_EDAN010714 [Ephemera danica]